MNIIKLVVAFLLSFAQIVTPYFSFAFKGIDSYFDDWSADDAYTADYAINLEKDPDKDFVILNLADIQLSPDEVYGSTGEKTNKIIKEAVAQAKPDLITLSGDNSSSMMGYIELAKLLDSFKIPWAPVMGNHDGSNGNKIQEAWDSYILTHSDYCIFKFGPKDMGFGNYVINITEKDENGNSKIVHTLYMMDTHSDADDTDAGVVNYGKAEDGSDAIGYDHLWANQIEWYKWAVEGTEKLAGRNVESTVIMHIPCYEYRTARDLMCDVTEPTEEGGDTVWTPKAEYDDAFGTLNEGICSPEGSNGFFSVLLSLGSTKNIIVGHDHKNNMCVNYEGVNLNYAMKTGYGSYWMAEKIGWSTLTVDSDGSASFAHTYYAG